MEPEGLLNCSKQHTFDLLLIRICYRCKICNSTVTFNHVIHRSVKSLKWRLTCSRWDWLNKVDRSILNVTVIYIWYAFPLQWEVPLYYGSCRRGVAPLFIPCGLSLHVGRLNACYTMQQTYLKYSHFYFIWNIYKRLSYSEQTKVPQGNFCSFGAVCHVASLVVLHYLIIFPYLITFIYVSDVKHFSCEEETWKHIS